jgi:hypothetical protein
MFYLLSCSSIEVLTCRQWDCIFNGDFQAGYAELVLEITAGPGGDGGNGGESGSIVNIFLKLIGTNFIL